MSLYTTITDCYDRIFPVNEQTLAFAGKPAGNAALLDIGCATGGHCIALAGAGWKAVGMDPSPTMIERAIDAKRSLAAEIAARVDFKIGGMLDVAGLPPSERFDLILCTGNTVPHLSSEEELKKFLAACRAIMEKGSRMIVQTLNYSKILAEKPSELPSVRDEGFLFSRRYEYREDGGISFETTFEAGGNSVEDSTRLWPFTPGALIRCASEAGLKDTKSFGSWDGRIFDEKSDIQLILELRR